MGEQLKLDVGVRNPVSEKLKQQLGDWTCLYPFFESEEWQKTKLLLRKDVNSIVPDVDVWFRAFTECRYETLNVVFLGLCPYHTRDQYTKALVADGLAFSTDTKHSVPPSLFKVYKAIEDDLWDGYNVEMLRWNKLDFLARQGILMGNVAMTTVEGTAAYHTEVWRPFTNFLLDTLNNEKKNLIFVGFGAVANKALLSINRAEHTVIELEHPAASAYENRAWRHEKVFSRINEILEKQQKPPILWDKYLVDMEVPF